VRCFECGAPATEQHHVIPKSKGGTKTVPLCSPCHGLAHSVKRRSIPALTLAALARKRARGERTGELPYGMQLAIDGVHLQEDAAEQATIRRIIELRQSDLSIRAIAAALNDEGVPARGARWHPTTVHRILGGVS